PGRKPDNLSAFVRVWPVASKIAFPSSRAASPRPSIDGIDPATANAPMVALHQTQLHEVFSRQLYRDPVTHPLPLRDFAVTGPRGMSSTSSALRRISGSRATAVSRCSRAAAQSPPGYWLLTTLEGVGRDLTDYTLLAPEYKWTLMDFRRPSVSPF